MLGANSSVLVSCHTEQTSTSSLNTSKPVGFLRILSEDALDGDLIHTDCGISWGNWESGQTVALSHRRAAATAAGLGRSVLTLCRSWERNGDWYPSAHWLCGVKQKPLAHPGCHPAVCQAVCRGQDSNGRVCHSFALQSVDGLWPNNPLMSNGAMTKNMLQMSWYVSWSDSTP